MKHDTNRAGRFSVPQVVKFFVPMVVFLALTSCETTSTTSTRGASGRLPASALTNPSVQALNAQIATEPVGNYYIGRRWWVDGTRFWGYLRKPREPWSEAKLVIMNESASQQPDRVPEEGVDRPHGYDHNYEYRVWGSFTGQTIYDPNSNFMLPEFRISKYETLNTSPGFLFWPGENYSPRKLPPKHPPLP
tara:strand:- start:154 stop:726 length:573 start_codon:yes stop_codon:yes gene_type:complete